MSLVQIKQTKDKITISLSKSICDKNVQIYHQMACLYWLIMQLTIIIKLYVLKSPIESTLSSWNYRVMFRKRIGMLRPEKIQINNSYI